MWARCETGHNSQGSAGFQTRFGNLRHVKLRVWAFVDIPGILSSQVTVGGESLTNERSITRKGLG